MILLGTALARDTWCLTDAGRAGLDGPRWLHSCGWHLGGDTGRLNSTGTFPLSMWSQSFWARLSSKVVNAAAPGSRRDYWSSRDPERSCKASSHLTVEVLAGHSSYILFIKQVTMARPVWRGMKLDSSFSSRRKEFATPCLLPQAANP